MKKLFLILSLCLCLGCETLSGGRKIDMPTIDLPKKIEKPEIVSKVISFENKYWVAYSYNDSLRLYRFLVEQDGYIDKLELRINLQNQLIQKFGSK